VATLETSADLIEHLHGEPQQQQIHMPYLEVFIDCLLSRFPARQPGGEISD